MVIELPHTKAHLAKGLVTKKESQDFNLLNLDEFIETISEVA